MSTERVGLVQKVSPMAYVVFFLATSFYFYEYFLQISPSVLTTELMHDLKINAGTLGTISAFYYYTYTLFQLPAGLLIDKFGVKYVLPIVILICASGAYCFGATNNITIVALGRLLMGAGSAFAFISSLYLILRWFPKHYFPILVGITQLMGSVGAMVGGAPLAMLNKNFGWHHTITIMSAVGVALAIVIAIVVRCKPPRTAVGVNKRPNSIKKSLMRVILTPQTWPIALYSCLIWAPIAAFAGLWGVPFLAAKFAISTIEAGTMIIPVWLGIALACPIAGALSEYLKNRIKLLSTVSLIGLVASISLIYLPIPIWLGYVLLFAIGVSASGQSLAFVIITDIQPLAVSSAAIGLNNTAIVCGAIVLQPLIGQLLDLHWDGAMHAGVAVYNTFNFQVALIALPVCYALCCVISMVFIKESYPRGRAKQLS
jgi:MFS family permease